jgi:ribulose-phosphate 3-epimerase
MTMRIQPSILSADFVNFERDFASISAADGIHVDVMDGHFVPNMTFGLPMVKRMQEISTLPLDVHLMIDNPDHWAPIYAALGVFSVTFHLEAVRNALDTAQAIKAAGSRVGIAIKPNTPVSEIESLIGEIHQVLVMSVEPGFGGQSFIPSALEKISTARSLINANNPSVWLQVDGGIDLTNISDVATAGADTFVAGSAVFGSDNRNETITRLRDLAIKAAKG